MRSSELKWSVFDLRTPGDKDQEQHSSVVNLVFGEVDRVPQPVCPHGEHDHAGHQHVISLLDITVLSPYLNICKQALNHQQVLLQDDIMLKLTPSDTQIGRIVFDWAVIL